MSEELKSEQKEHLLLTIGRKVGGLILLIAAGEVVLETLSAAQSLLAIGAAAIGVQTSRDKRKT